MAKTNGISSIKFGLLDDEGNIIKEGFAPFEIDLDTTELDDEEAPEVGDLVKFNRDGYDVTEGGVYEIEDVIEDINKIIITDDNGDVHSWSYPNEAYTLIKRKTEQELIANLSKEVAELKSQLTDLKAEVAIEKLHNSHERNLERFKKTWGWIHD